MTFVEKLDDLISQKGITRNKLLLELNLGKNSFVNWTNRGTLPNGETILALAEYFGVSSDYLLGIEKSNDKYVSIPKDSLIALIENMTPESRQKLEDFVKNDFRFDLKE